MIDGRTAGGDCDSLGVLYIRSGYLFMFISRRSLDVTVHRPSSFVTLLHRASAVRTSHYCIIIHPAPR